MESFSQLINFICNNFWAIMLAIVLFKHWPITGIFICLLNLLNTLSPIKTVWYMILTSLILLGALFEPDHSKINNIFLPPGFDVNDYRKK